MPSAYTDTYCPAARPRPLRLLDEYHARGHQEADRRQQRREPAMV